MGASAIEQIYLPNCLCASGIKPTKSQISKEDWTFKLARSTYAQWPRVSPRTTTSRHRRTVPVLSAGPAASHRRTAPVLSADPGASHRRTAPVREPRHHREPRRFPPRAPRLRIIPLSPAIPRPHHSPEPCHSTPASFLRTLPLQISFRTHSVPVNPDIQIKTIFTAHFTLSRNSS